MVLIDKSGHERARKIRSFNKDKGEDKMRIMFFLEPADVKDTGFLTYDYDDAKKDDDQWLYLPALRKTKRIASSDKSGSFMGSDFNYSDMTRKDLDAYDFKILKEEEVRGARSWVIEATPKTREEIRDRLHRHAFVRQTTMWSPAPCTGKRWRQFQIPTPRSANRRHLDHHREHHDQCRQGDVAQDPLRFGNVIQPETHRICLP